ncbi:zf-TFIIB domain-containing protein [Martelella mediterranea]|uniref:TFIIB-type zinc ribbon-containing protein n=1 Tax=Martelella mediterranea TaxID=293089 RepID=UPI001E2AA944|nr:zf-TFIIB domain-containing protein [Martelella mediterranea]MCD1635883.1 zf-TFIIB domain-containing protein [Martelella mediterranea]
MQCPLDGQTLVIAERSGIEIDYCPKCRGVWLDRGELDKIVERSGQAAIEPVRGRESREAPSFGRDHDDDRPGHGSKPYKKKKKESFLSDLFDF